MSAPEYAQVLWIEGHSVSICPLCHSVVLEQSWDAHATWHAPQGYMAPDGFCDRCQTSVWTRSDGTLRGHPCSPSATTPDEPTDSLPDPKGHPSP